MGGERDRGRIPKSKYEFVVSATGTARLEPNIQYPYLLTLCSIAMI